MKIGMAEEIVSAEPSAGPRGRAPTGESWVKLPEAENFLECRHLKEWQMYQILDIWDKTFSSV